MPRSAQNGADRTTRPSDTLRNAARAQGPIYWYALLCKAPKTNSRSNPACNAFPGPTVHALSKKWLPAWHSQKNEGRTQPRAKRGEILKHRILFGLAIFASAAACAHADTVANAVGRVFGSFGAGVGQAATQPLRDSQPQWITIEPRGKEDCLAESHGVINSTYVRCRRGRQELTRFDAAGNQIVLSERAIPEW